MRFAPERLAQSGGNRPRLEQVQHVVVVGGGLAGVAAATVLGERGAAVTLLEREDFLGGRAGAWTDRFANGEPFEMERGFHAFFRQYYNLRALLRRIDPRLHRLVALEDYPLLGPGGARESFAAFPRRTPLNIIELLRRTPRLRLSDLPRLHVSAAVEMLAYDEERTCRRFDSVTARDYLDSLNFPAPARQMLFDVFARSFFNPEDQMSAAELLMMFHFYFTGNPEGLVFDVVCEPFSDVIWRPMRRYLEGLGVTMKLGRPAGAVRRRPGGGWLVEVGAGEESPLAADALVLALDVPGLQALVDRSPSLSVGADGARGCLRLPGRQRAAGEPGRGGRAGLVGAAPRVAGTAFLTCDPDSPLSASAGCPPPFATRPPPPWSPVGARAGEPPARSRRPPRPRGGGR